MYVCMYVCDGREVGIRCTAFSPLGSPSYTELHMDRGLNTLHDPVPELLPLLPSYAYAFREYFSHAHTF